MTAPSDRAHHPHLEDIAAEDLVELGEFLGFLYDWSYAERDALALAWRRFTISVFSYAELQSDLARFYSLLDPNAWIRDETATEDEGDWE